MTRLAGRWLLSAVPLVFAVSVLTFLLESLAPGDAATTLLGITATPQQLAQVRAQLHLDQSLPGQYWHWLTAAVQGNLGRSLLNGQSVASILDQRLGVTLSLIGGSLLVSGLLGVGLGLLAATRRGRLGRSVDIVSLAGLAAPSYWLGLVLVAIFAVSFRAFPATGYVSPGHSFTGWLHSLVLPVFTLGFGGSAVVAKQTRDAVAHELSRMYVTALRARGLTERTILIRHVLKNAAVPVITVLGLLVIGLLGGSVLAETVFVLPGLGGLAASSAVSHDLPVVQGVAVYFTLIVVAVSLVTEMLYAWVNPRSRR